MEIRAFREGDAPALRAVFASAIHGTASAYYTREQCDAWCPADYDIAGWAERIAGIAPFVVEEGGEIVGYADVQNDGYIDHFFVASTAARRGVGSALMRRIHEEAAARGLTALYSNVSLAAQPFFAKWGFAIEQEQEVAVRGVTLRNARMRKDLGGGA
jgi:putative acetyltransferase